MEVAKVGNISHQEFMDRFYNRDIPVVFQSASKAWKASKLFTPDFFRKNFGDRKTVVLGQEYSMSTLLDMIENSSHQNPAPYPIIFDIPTQLPEIMPLISPLSLGFAQPNWFESKAFPLRIKGSGTELFLGGPGGKFPRLHLDFYHTNAWVTQLYGDKDFIVFPPGQDQYLYPKPDNPWVSSVNCFEPDFEKYPDYRLATPIRVTIKQGETIFVPTGIWHCSEPLTPSISVIFDQMNRKNYDLWLKDVYHEHFKTNKIKGLSVYLYGLLAKPLCLAGDAIGLKRDRYRKPMKS